MVAVANANGVFATLEYNYTGSEISELSANTKTQVQYMPKLIEPWQAQDIVNDDIGGYLYNPMANIAPLIISVANTIVQTNISSNNCLPEPVATSANTLLASSSKYLDHTNRISGVTEFDGSDLINPYYQLAISYGQNAMYLTNQTDGVSNNAPILGCFTSLFIKDELLTVANTISDYGNIVQNSITITESTTTDPETNETITEVSYSSNLTSEQITQLTQGMSQANELVGGCVQRDVDFYTKLKDLNEKYNKVRPFSRMGESQTFLIKNYIGTPKLLERLTEPEPRDVYGNL